MEYTKPTELEQLSASEANAVLIELQSRCDRQLQRIMELEYKYDELSKMLRKEGKDRVRSEGDRFLSNYGSSGRPGPWN
jgi:hypothetical protein